MAKWLDMEFSRWAITARVALTLVAVLMAGAAGIQPAQAQTNLKVLYSFKGLKASDGFEPGGTLFRDAAGNLYGTTYYGGDRTCALLQGCGSVFKVDSAGKETVLYNFTGGSPQTGAFTGVVRDGAGNLYGTAASGETNSHGSVFKVDPAGNETVLYTFTGLADGANPYAGLIRDAAGNFYGTTMFGGASGNGTVFKVDASGNETVLYSFAGGTDGNYPEASLVVDAARNFYGTTFAGGTYGCGTVFKLDSTGKKTVVYNFAGGADGAGPAAGLIRDAAGNFYGTTIGGGVSNGGTVFRVDATGQETVLYSFTGGADGGYAETGLVRDGAGNLYGTTFFGGDLSCGSGKGCGVVFRLDATGNQTMLHSFTGGTDGAYPNAGLVLDSAGKLYGNTSIGGDLSCNAPYGCGTVFELTH